MDFRSILGTSDTRRLELVEKLITAGMGCPVMNY